MRRPLTGVVGQLARCSLEVVGWLPSAPGAPPEKYFDALAERAATGQQLTEEERMAFLRRHDEYMV